MVHNRTRSFSLDNILSVRAVAKSGSVRAASEALRLSHTTVMRRIASAERELGVTIFLKSPAGYVLTDAGRVVAEHAELLSDNAIALRRAIGGQNRAPSGRVRITSDFTLLTRCIAPQMVKFASEYPNLEIELLVGDTLRDISRQDAEIAVRIGSTPPDHHVGVCIGEAAEAVYLSKNTDASITDVANGVMPLIAWSRSSAFLDRARKHGLGQPHVGPICVDAAGQCALAENGVGAVILPCIVGDSSEFLKRASGSDPIPTLPIWIVAHSDLAKTAKVKAVTTFLVKTLRSYLPRLAGRKR